jgi:myo-inositol 2-dehydrogenase/D-chiro-inositol 1-dehydrogenase
MTRILVVGGGSIGQRHMKNFLAQGCEVEGVEPKEDVRNEVIKEIGIPVHEDLHKALEGDFVAAVIGTPARFHIECALECAKKGLHILCEKPLCLDFEEVHPKEDAAQQKLRTQREQKNLKDLFKLIEEKKLVAMIGYMNRHSEPVKKIKELIEQKVVGDPVAFHSENSHSANLMHLGHPPDSWFIGHKEMGGDTMLEDSHGINLLLHIGGGIESVMCMTGKVTDITTTSNDNAELILKFKNGVYGTAHTDLFCNQSRAHFLVRCTEGTILWDRQGDNDVAVMRVDEGKVKHEKVHSMKEKRDQWFINEEKLFLECIQQGKLPPLEYNLRSGYETMKVIMAASLSNKEGRTVKVDEIFSPY